ncbi:MAG: porin family protein [Chitinophagaceae bacterium]
MKKLFFYLLLLSPIILKAQIGLKGGLNFAKVTKASDINSSTRSGFHAGVFLAPPSKKILSSRTELLFSRQGYDYKNSVNTGTVDMDYIQVGQLMSVNITKFFSLLFGAQTSYLVSAQVDSSNNTGNSTENKIMDLYNRIDYGYAIGAEIHPVAGLIISTRYNVSLAKVYKDIQGFQKPSFTSEDAKNNVIQVSIGWRFGKKPTSKKKEKE